MSKYEADRNAANRLIKSAKEQLPFMERKDILFYGKFSSFDDVAVIELHPEHTGVADLIRIEVKI